MGITLVLFQTWGTNFEVRGALFSNVLVLVTWGHESANLGIIMVLFLTGEGF